MVVSFYCFRKLRQRNEPDVMSKPTSLTSHKPTTLYIIQETVQIFKQRVKREKELNETSFSSFSPLTISSILPQSS